MARGLGKEVRRELRGGAIDKGSSGRADRHGAEPHPVVGPDVGVVEDDACRHAEATLPPGVREGQMKLGGEHVRELVEREGGLVREHAGSLRPEPDGDELLVLAVREVDQTVDATAEAADAS